MGGNEKLKNKTVEEKIKYSNKTVNDVKMEEENKKEEKMDEKKETMTKAKMKMKGLVIDIKKIKEENGMGDDDEEEDVEAEIVIKKPGKLKMGLSINTSARNNSSRTSTESSGGRTNERKRVLSMDKLKIQTNQRTTKRDARTARLPMKHQNTYSSLTQHQKIVHSARAHKYNPTNINQISTNRKRNQQEAKRTTKKTKSVRTPGDVGSPTIMINYNMLGSKSNQVSPKKKRTKGNVHSPNVRFRDTLLPDHVQQKQQIKQKNEEENLSPMAEFNLNHISEINGGLMIIEEEEDTPSDEDTYEFIEEDISENHLKQITALRTSTTTTTKEKYKVKEKKQKTTLRKILEKLCGCFQAPEEDDDEQGKTSNRVSDETPRMEIKVNSLVKSPQHSSPGIPTLPLSNAKLSSGLATPSSRPSSDGSRQPELLSSRSYQLTPSVSSQSLSVMEDVEVVADLAETSSSVVRIGRSPSVQGLVLIKQPSVASSMNGSKGGSTCSTPAVGDNIQIGGKIDEFDLMSRLEHPHIATVYGQEVSSKTIISKFYPETLHDWILRQGKLTVVDARRVLRELLSAVHYLQSVHGFIHGDIKSQNILMSEDSEVKLADFGAARYLGSSLIHNVPVTEMVMGTKMFSAPEHIFQHFLVQEDDSDSDSDDGFPEPPQIVYRISKQSDSWSIGLVLYECLTGRQAFLDVIEGAQTEFDVIGRLSTQFSKIPPLDLSSISNSDARDFISQCLVMDPNDRPTIAQLSNHPYVH